MHAVTPLAELLIAAGSILLLRASGAWLAAYIIERQGG